MYVPFDGELSTKDAIARELLAEASERSAARHRDDASDERDGSSGIHSAECAVDVEILTGDAK